MLQEQCAEGLLRGVDGHVDDEEAALVRDAGYAGRMWFDVEVVRCIVAVVWEAGQRG